jgi:hypothetical protein
MNNPALNKELNEAEMDYLESFIPELAVYALRKAAIDALAQGPVLGWEKDRLVWYQQDGSIKEYKEGDV